LTEPLHFYCPFCSASIEVTSALAASKGVKVKCSGCQRKVKVPEGLLADFPEPDDDDDFLSGVPMVASGDEDILTEADLAIESEETQESSESAAKPSLLDNDFEFSIAESASSAEAQSEQDDDQEDNHSTTSNGNDDSVDPETDMLLDGPQNESKTGGDEDLNQLLAGVADVSRPPAEKGSFGIRCSVCDSKLFVSLGQVGKEIKCSDCFTMIKVREPTAQEKEQIEKQIGLSLENEQQLNDSAMADDGELTLAPLAEDEMEEVEVVAEIVEEDDDEPLTLREEPVTELGEVSGGEISDDDFADVLLDDDDDLGEDLLAGDLSLSGPMELEDASFVDPAMLAAAAEKSKDLKKKKQQSEGSAGEDTLNPYRSKSAQQAEKREQEKSFKPKPKKSGKEFPKMRFDAFFGAAVELVTESSVAVRGFIVAALFRIGNLQRDRCADDGRYSDDGILAVRRRLVAVRDWHTLAVVFLRRRFQRSGPRQEENQFVEVGPLDRVVQHPFNNCR